MIICIINRTSNFAFDILGIKKIQSRGKRARGEKHILIRMECRFRDNLLSGHTQMTQNPFVYSFFSGFLSHKLSGILGFDKNNRIMTNMP